MAKRPSLSYVPEDLQGETLFQTATELIDLARLPSPEVPIAKPLDPVFEHLLTDYDDMEAVLAYHNMFIKPQLGSKQALLYVMNLFAIGAELKEWFEVDFTLPAYKFSLDFDEFPEHLDIDNLLDVVDAVKNERSRLAVIRQPEEFMDMFILDHTLLGDGILSDVSGYGYRGTNIFLAQRYRRYVNVREDYPPLIDSWQSSRFGSWVRGSDHMGDQPLDWFDLGFERHKLPFFMYRGTITTSYTRAMAAASKINRYELGMGHFIMSESDLSGGDVLPLAIWEFEDNIGKVGAFDVLIDGALSQDYTLSGLRYDLVYSRILTPYFDISIDVPDVSIYSSNEGIQYAHAVYEPDENSSVITGVQDDHFRVPRYGFGQPTGDPQTYVSSVHSSHRSELV